MEVPRRPFNSEITGQVNLHATRCSQSITLTVQCSAVALGEEAADVVHQPTASKSGLRRLSEVGPN